ncbi:reverse transcriptase [Gossypium australe]|uniref:Reverse transcriptase n=1 Tax=Gossypium australe TaxID=47621 RepID=A0A5B6TWG0_9ROSI|nr:reverse transcriptase [Gossypium australe]
MAGQRHTRNRINELEDENGNKASTTDDMLKIASDYFEKLFFASEAGIDDRIFGLVEKRVMECMNANLTKPFSEEEVCNVVKSMPALKAPGIDGFAAIFFQRYWHIIGTDIVGYCLDILNGQREVSDLNKTCIVLISKLDKPKNMSQFRPISLCNVIYKFIAKVMVIRMSDILGDCINESQGAFIPGRLISDNVLIAYEVLHSLKMKKSGRKGNFALKLDMSKAYDQVEWNFLAGMMKSLGFHDDWIVLVMRCICSVSYSVQLNGICSDWFSPSRGLRQGDPLSPYLFYICAEGFSSLLEEVKNSGGMQGATIGRERISINHLFFADDCILFGDATSEGVHTVRDIIREYETNAGQRVNYDKSLIFFGTNVQEEMKEEVTRILGVRVASSLEKYLGLPMMVGRRKSWAFANFKDRFRKRIEGWSLRYLSMGGKKNVMNRFWWANSKTKSGIHWSNWDALCLPKFAGGLGFKNLFLFNKALLAKQAWRILTNSHCLLAKVLKARYFPNSDFLAAKVGSYPSFTWRSICSVRDLIEEGMVWRIGNGECVNIWNDPWLPGREKNKISGHEIRVQWTSISNLMHPDSNTWNADLIRRLVDDDTARQILSIPLSGGNLLDTVVWKFEGSGEYSVRSGYRTLAPSLVSTNSNNYNNEAFTDFYKDLWGLNIPSKIKIHVWRLFNIWIPHYCNLAKRKLSAESLCPLCKEEMENLNHLLWSCGVLRQVCAYFQIKTYQFENLGDPKVCFARFFTATEIQQKSIIAISIWSLWFRRNKLTHEGMKFKIKKVLGFIRGYTQDIILTHSNLQNKVNRSLQDKWQAPEIGFIKLNFDASFHSKDKTAISAVIARDSTGNILGAETYLFADVADPFVAEARACERALIFAKTMGFSCLAVEGDALSVIKSIKRRGIDRSVIRSVTRHIFLMGLTFEKVSYRFVPRNVNGVAHTMALEGR